MDSLSAALDELLVASDFCGAVRVDHGSAVVAAAARGLPGLLATHLSG